MKVCKSCGEEFEPTRKNQVNCKGSCPKDQRMKRMILGGGIKRKGNTTTVTGALNCYMYMKGLL